MRLAVAVDGGNSKTDAALVREDGAVLGLARGPRFPLSEDLRGPKTYRTCALRAQARSPADAGLVHMANQINAAADHQNGRHGPQNKDWHLSSSSI